MGEVTKAWTPPSLAPWPLSEQIAEVKRELAIRENAYPGFVARGRTDKLAADQQYGRLQAALKTLLWCERNRDMLRGMKLTEASPATEVANG